MRIVNTLYILVDLLLTPRVLPVGSVNGFAGQHDDVPGFGGAEQVAREGCVHFDTI